MKFTKINQIILLFVCLMSVGKIMTVTPLDDIYQDLSNGYLNESSKLIISRSSKNLDKVGLKIGDEIISINNKPVESQLEIRELFFQNRGQKVNLQFIRENQVSNITATIPADFIPFGYDSEFSFNDQIKVGKNFIQILTYHLYEKQFEIDPLFPDLNKKVFITRSVAYIIALILIASSFGLLFEFRLSWLIISTNYVIVLVNSLFTYNKPIVFFEILLSFLMLVLLAYSFYITFIQGVNSEKKL